MMTRQGTGAVPPIGPWASIDTHALRHNLAQVRGRIGHEAGGQPLERARLWAVMKADAYGHGLEHALAALHQADGIALSRLEDAIRARRLGWRRPILLLSGAGLALEPYCGAATDELASDPLGDPALGELHVTVDDDSTLRRLEARAPAPTRLHAWLRYAGRLRQLGFDEDSYPGAFRRLQALQKAGILAGAGHLQHYAMAEHPVALATETQEFTTLLADLPGPLCVGNSAALYGVLPLRDMAWEHWLRCGLALYGASALPGMTGSQLGLRPAMSLHARLLCIRRVNAGDSVGYGDSFRAEGDTCIGVVDIGYGHGLPRHLWRQGSVLVGDRGRRVRLAGRLAMESLTVDLGPDPDERPGDIVTLWGTAPGGATLPVETAAAACDTIAAELLTGLTERVPRVPLRHE